MTDYFEQVAKGLVAAAEHRVHLPWYRRIRRTRRLALVLTFASLVAAGTALAAVGTFDSTTTVVATRCEITTVSGTATLAQPCVFTLGDGTRFSCPPSFGHTEQSADTLEHASACRRLPPVAITAASRPVAAQIQAAGACIADNGFHVSGGPNLEHPGGRGAASLVGELFIEHGNSPIEIGFYSSPSSAQQSLGTVARNTHHGPLERRGNVLLAWSRAPSAGNRTALEHCLG